MGSTAELFVAQMQDYLALGSEGRINVPGVAAGNWRWRMAPGAPAAGLAADIRRLTEVYGRESKRTPRWGFFYHSVAL